MNGSPAQWASCCCSRLAVGCAGSDPHGDRRAAGTGWHRRRRSGAAGAGASGVAGTGATGRGVTGGAVAGKRRRRGATGAAGSGGAVGGSRRARARAARVDRLAAAAPAGAMAGRGGADGVAAGAEPAAATAWGDRRRRFGRRGQRTGCPSAGCAKMIPRPSGGRITGRERSHLDFPASYDGIKPFPLLMGFHAQVTRSIRSKASPTTPDSPPNYVRAFPKSAGNEWVYNTDLSAKVYKAYDDLMANYCIDYEPRVRDRP